MKPFSLHSPKTILLALYGLLCFSLPLTLAQAQAPVFRTLHNFNSYADGGNPQTDLVQASDGTFYGVTSEGGPANDGTVFSLKNGVLTMLHSFTGSPDGAYPVGRLLLASDGNLYGTTEAGGVNSGTVYKITITPGTPNTYTYHKIIAFTYKVADYPASGLLENNGSLYGTSIYGGLYNSGSIFKINNFATTPTSSLYYSFTGGASGYQPYSGLILATDGNLYGTTYYGGTSGRGIIYQITLGSSPVFTVTHIFNDAQYDDPQSDLYQASDGNLYGVAPNGGPSGDGEIFEIGLGTGAAFHILYNFTNFDNNIGGKTPQSRLVPGPDGMLYGTTQSGGYGNGTGYGTIYKIPLATSSGMPGGPLTTIYKFTNTADGYSPYAGVTVGQDGKLYGVTSQGGVRTNNAPSRSLGVIYSVHTDGTGFDPIFPFTNGFVDGYNPQSKMVEGADGSLYGTTSGGLSSQGVVFKTNPNGAYTILHYFADGDVPSDGAQPVGKLLLGRDGYLYGTTENGGANGVGTVYRLLSNGTNYSVLYSFTGSAASGASPTSGLVQGTGTDDALYGTTQFGGATSNGIVFQITTSGRFTLLHSFSGYSTDGQFPLAGVIVGSDGKLYGVTPQGGSNNYGTLYSLNTDGSGYAETAFLPAIGYAAAGDLVEYAPGVFYGTTTQGGQNGTGTIYQATATGSFTPVYANAGSPAGLLIGSDGGLYGVTAPAGSDSGTIFRLTTGGAFTTLYTFAGHNGVNPLGALVQGMDGRLDGTTFSGGSGYNGGTAFSLDLDLPIINLVSPLSVSAGSAVTLTGHNFTGVTDVKFGTASAASFTVDSDTQITAVVPASAPATGKVYVITARGNASRGYYTLH